MTRVGRIYLSEVYKPTKQAQYPIRLGHRDPSTRVRTDGTTLVADGRDTYLAASLRLDFIDEAEMFANVAELRRARGSSKDVLVVDERSSTTTLMWRMVYGLVVNEDLINNPSFGRFSHVLEIEEMP